MSKTETKTPKSVVASLLSIRATPEGEHAVLDHYQHLIIATLRRSEDRDIYRMNLQEVREALFKEKPSRATEFWLQLLGEPPFTVFLEMGLQEWMGLLSDFQTKWDVPACIRMVKANVHEKLCRKKIVNVSFLAGHPEATQEANLVETARELHLAVLDHAEACNVWESLLAKTPSRKKRA